MDQSFKQNDINRYQKAEQIGNGTYGTVYKAIDQKTGETVAMKKMNFEVIQEGIPSTALREISLLREISHENIIKLLDVVIDGQSIFLVFQYAEKDLKQYLEDLGDKKLEPAQIKKFMYQILNGINACHARRTLHRDLKPQNILITSDGTIKIADFGLSRTFSIPIRPYTHQVVTLWYRPPEILLGAIQYCTPCDIWSVGCIFVQMVTQTALFQGDSEIDQIFKIFRTLGTPNETVWPGVNSLREFANKTFPIWPQNTVDKVENLQSLEIDGLDLLQPYFAYI